MNRSRIIVQLLEVEKSLWKQGQAMEKLIGCEGEIVYLVSEVNALNNVVC